MQTNTLRHQWNTAHHQEAVVTNPDVHHIPGGGTFEYPDTLYSIAGKTAFEALQRVVGQSRRADGTLDPSVAPLGASPNWNLIASGQGEPPQSRDPIIDKYLQTRVKEVEKVAKEVEGNYGEVMKKMRTGVEAGIAQGYIPEYVTDRFTALELTTVQVVDSALMEPGVLGSYSFFDKIKITHEAGLEGEIAIVHENVHKLSGASFGHNYFDELVRNRIGFEESGRHTGLNEALTHHVALSTVNGNFETIDPDKRRDGDTKYYAVRKVAAALVEKSSGLVETKFLTRGLFEDTDIGSGFEDRRVMISALRKAYGTGAVRKIDALFAAALEIDDGGVADWESRLNLLIDSIQSPQVVDGQVMVGSVDLADA